MGRFIPSFHFIPATDKLKPEFCDSVMNYYFYNQRLKYLLDGKNVDEIEGYATGEFNLNPYKRIFRSLRKQMKSANMSNVPKSTIDNMDKTGIQWDCLALIPPKLNAAAATVQKIPLEVSCQCQDTLAVKKKKEDFEFLKSKKKMEQVLQPLYDSMNLGKPDLGTTKYSSVPFTALPMDLDINNEDEFRVFASIIYNLAPETAFETILQTFYETRKIDQIKLMEIHDQLKFGISAHQCRHDRVTGLPNAEYIYPNRIRSDGAMLPDHSDDTIRIVDFQVTPFELFNYFPEEICDEDMLNDIINGAGSKGTWGAGYCNCNQSSPQHRNNWDNYKMQLLYVEVRSVDSVMLGQKKNSRYKYVTEDEARCTERVWAQNTYSFYWLVNTKWFFAIDRLPFAYRSKGNETYTNFSTQIYRSQKKSAVELSIGENKKAQIADIKLQHTLIMSSPTGKIIDLKYIRNVMESLTDGADSYTEEELVDRAIEENIHIIDTAGFEGKATNQFVPVKDLPGGVREDILGYYRVMAEAIKNISMITGINDQLTGQSANPEGLVGLQKLLINSSVNTINYLNEGVVIQYKGLFNIWANYVQQAIKEGGEVKQAIISMIGTEKVDIIEALNDVPLHQIATVISLGQREEERAQFKYELAQLRQKGVLSAAEEYMIINTRNPKDAFWLLAVAEGRFIRRQDKIRQEALAARQKEVEQQGINMSNNTQLQSQAKIEQINATGNVEAELLKLANQLGLNAEQLKGLIKRQLQQERMAGQTNKSLQSIYANKNVADQTTFQ